MRSLKAQPRLGAIRQVRGFLWKPKRVSNETRWLEIAVWKEKWNGGKWSPIAWVDQKGWFK